MKRVIWHLAVPLSRLEIYLGGYGYIPSFLFNLQAPDWSTLEKIHQARADCDDNRKHLSSSTPLTPISPRCRHWQLNGAPPLQVKKKCFCAQVKKNWRLHGTLPSAEFRLLHLPACTCTTLSPPFLPSSQQLLSDYLFLHGLSSCLRHRYSSCRHPQSLLLTVHIRRFHEISSHYCIQWCGWGKIQGLNTKNLPHANELSASVEFWSTTRCIILFSIFSPNPASSLFGFPKSPK